MDYFKDFRNTLHYANVYNNNKLFRYSIVEFMTYFTSGLKFKGLVIGSKLMYSPVKRQIIKYFKKIENGCTFSSSTEILIILN